MTREEAEKLASRKGKEHAGSENKWGPKRVNFEAGFMAAYDLLTSSKPPQRSWEIIGGDETAMGDSNPFRNHNAAFEILEFLQEHYPDQPWELKETSR